ncbi:MAG TPA: cytochrome c [Tepidisphaeraceae bacterium]|nr:cytochrome c [Tepidisphaeraceae bacterium]
MRHRKKKGVAGRLEVLAGIVLAALATNYSFAADTPADDWKAPASAAAKKNPVPTSAEAVAAGKKIYESSCLACHGAAGKGDGPAAIALTPKPKDLSDPKIASQSDGALFWKVTEGKAPMPSYLKLLSDTDRWRVIDYVRTIAPPPAKKPPAPSPDGAEVNAGTQGVAATHAGELTATTPVTQDDLDELNRKIRGLQDQIRSAIPGTEHLVIAGDAAVGFTNQRNTDSTFSANVSPLILWQPTDRLLFEAAFGLGVSTDASSNSSTSVDLGVADATYVVNDYLLVGGGLFVVPFGQYHNHFDPPWINKLPDDPLVFGGNGIAPISEVGVFARGAAPIGNMKMTYDAYVTNGPQLITRDPAAAGSLNFSDYTDLNNGKAVGGRLGFLPVPQLETGYSFEYAQTAPDGFEHAYALLQAVDLNWVQEVRPLGGVVTARTEWVWSEVANATYDPKGALGFGPTSFGNYRNGGYAELAYRPTLSGSHILQNLEFITRYNLLRTPLRSPGGEHEQAIEFGIDYWITPSVVLKAAYEVDDRKIGPSENAVFFQLGFGL